MRAARSTRPKYKPWKLISYHAFADERRAREFEYNLKSGSGRAFAEIVFGDFRQAIDHQ